MSPVESIASADHKSSQSGELRLEDVLDRIDGTIRAAVRRHCGGKRGLDVDDVVQDVLLKVVRNLHGFDRKRGTLTGWVHAIARHHCYDLLQRRELDAISLDASTADAPWHEPESRAEDGPLRRAERQEMRRIIIDAIDRLRPDQRTIVRMRDVQGLDYGSIAEALMLKIGTVKSCLHRARVELRTRLARHDLQAA